MTKRINKQLTEEIVKPAKSRGILISLLGTLIVVFLVNLLATWYLKKHTTNRAYWLIREKWEMLLGLKQPVDWLILGDSSCNQGLVPSIFNEKLDVTSLNLCTVANILTLNDAWMLDKYIQKFGPPQNVLIVHVSDIWYRSVDYWSLAKVPLKWGYWGQLEPKITFSVRDTYKLFLRRYVSLYTENKSVASLFKIFLDTSNQNTEFRLETDGFMVWNQPDPGRVKYDTEEQVKLIEGKKFDISRPNRQALEAIATLAKEHGFNVYLVNSPIYEGLYENKDFRAYYSQMQETLSTYALKNERLYYIREPITFPKEQMQNTDHLIYSAAKVYTNKLATEIVLMQKDTKIQESK